jgi:heat shock protein HtpX
LTSPPGNLFQQQEANRRRTTWLVIGFVLFFAWLGFGGDYIYWLATRDAEPGRYHHVFPWFGLILSAIAIGVARYAYRTGPEKVLWATGAREVIDPQDDRERLLVNVVDEMAIAAGVPRPRVWIVPDDDPNAFATGHDPKDSHVAVTRGLLGICSRDELQAVIGHELGHVKNLDVRLMTTLAALVGAVLLMRDGMGRIMRGGLRFGSFGSGGGSSGGGGGGGRGGGGKKGGGAGVLIAVLLAVWIVSWLVAPLVTQLLALAVSRKREYLADAMSAQFTRNPLALASALAKIENAAAPTAAIKRGSAHLCIADPLGRRLTSHEGWLADTLATHPPMSMRISRLKGMGYAQLKKEGGTPA